MKTKIFDYNVSDIKSLKRDWILRLVICILLVGVAIWQGVLLAFELITTTIDQFKIISTSFVFATCLVYILLSIVYIRKHIKVINTIKSTGKCTSSVTFLFNVNKRGFVNMYKFLTFFLTFLSIFVLIAAITYAILSISFFRELSYFYPVLITLCLVGLFSSLHITTELKAQRKVSQINKF